MNESGGSNPLREASQLLSIFAFLLGVGCYLAGRNNVPIISTCMRGMETLLLWLFPAIAGVHLGEFPALVSAVVFGVLAFLCGVPFTPAISRLFGPSASVMQERLATFRASKKRKGVKVD